MSTLALNLDMARLLSPLSISCIPNAFASHRFLIDTFYVNKRVRTWGFSLNKGFYFSLSTSVPCFMGNLAIVISIVCLVDGI